MSNEFGEMYRRLDEKRDAGMTQADPCLRRDWEERRHAHWKLMRTAWERWQDLVFAHEAQGFTGRNPYE